MKHPDWFKRLLVTVEAHRTLPFRWAGRDDSHDCCTFAASCVDAMTGSDFVTRMLEHYHDEPSAIAYIQHCGGLIPLLDTYLGQQKPLSYLSRGDVVVLKAGAFPEGVGIYLGGDPERAIASASLHGGILLNPRSTARAAWGI